MRVEVLMPRLSDSAESGVVARWLRGDGEQVARGEGLVEVETDKSTVELQAEADGVLAIRALEGETVAVGAAIAEIVAEGTADAAVPAASGAALPGGAARRPLATPVARKLARRAGLNLSELAPGSGPDGRIQRADVEAWLARDAAPDARDERISPSPIQRRAAERVTAAKREIPHYYATIEVDASAAVDAARTGLVGLTDVIAFCTAGALRALPEVNASWADGEIVRRARVHLGMAVSLDDGGLLVPVLRDADARPLPDLAAELGRLVERARARALRPEELSGGTFTISNLGMYGVTEFHAIINPPESGILAVGALVERPALREGVLVSVPTLALSLSADHRVYAGVAAARFLAELKRRLESPGLV